MSGTRRRRPNQRKTRAGCGPPRRAVPNGYDALVRDFIAEFRDRHGVEMKYFGRLQSLRAAVETAALSDYPHGKRHPHQRRIPSRVLRRAAARLLSVEDQIADCANFEELHELVDEVVGSTRGIGELTVYDITTRIGAYLGLTPNYVFVHAGVRMGARALGFRGRNRIRMHELPKPFHELTPAEAEDCLCIYKEQLQRLAREAPV